MHNLRSNIAGRYFRRQQNDNSKLLDRCYVHSHFGSDRTIKQQHEEFFLSCDFTPCGTRLIVGLQSGIVAVYNNKNGSLYTTHQCHGSSVTHVKTSMDRNLLLTCSSYRRPLSRMWNIENNQLSVQLDFAEDEYLEFSKLNEDKIIGTSRSTATIYDVQTGQSIATFVPSIGNVYKEYRATFNPSDELILSGGLLWDVRSGRVLHQFELLSQKLPGVFHPNGLEIVSNSSVWDIRTFRLLRTVPQLELSIVKFSPQHVIYVIPSEVSRMISVIENGDCLEDTFKVLNSSDYSTIVTVNVGRNIYDLSVNRYGTQVASVENVGNFYWNFKSTVRLYNVGRRQHEDEFSLTDQNNFSLVGYDDEIMDIPNQQEQGDSTHDDYD